MMREQQKYEATIKRMYGFGHLANIPIKIGEILDTCL